LTNIHQEKWQGKQIEEAFESKKSGHDGKVQAPLYSTLSAELQAKHDYESSP